MGTLSVRARLVVLSSCLTVWGTLWACSPDEENPGTSRPRGTSSGGTSSGDTATSGGPGDGTGTTPPPVQVCGKLGNEAGVKAIAAQIVENAKADCRISLLAKNATNDNGESQHLMDCFGAFLGGGVACPGMSYVQGTTKDSLGKICESVLPKLKFSTQDWEAFGNFNKPDSAARKAFEGKLVGAELTGVAAIFEGKKNGLLNNEGVPIGKHTACEGTCEAGGQACIRIIDAGPDVRDTGTDG
jgi:hypothetical protein